MKISGVPEFFELNKNYTKSNLRKMCTALLDDMTIEKYVCEY